MKLDLAVLGNLLLDDVVYADGRTRMAQAGGATLYVALAARLWGLSVGLVAPLGDDYPAALLDALAERGVELGGLRPLGGSALRTWLLYEGRRRRVVPRLDGPSHAEVSPTAADLPAAWQCRACHLAPMPWEAQGRLVRALAGHPALLSLDPYALLDADGIAAWRRLLAGVDLLFLSEDELVVDGALDDPRPALTELCERPPGGRRTGRLRRVLFKRGARGGLAYDAVTGTFFPWPARAAAVVDPTGAGDAFAGGVLAGLLHEEPIERAVERGIVAASFALEGEGADGLLAATPALAEARRRDWFARGLQGAAYKATGKTRPARRGLQEGAACNRSLTRCRVRG